MVNDFFSTAQKESFGSLDFNKVRSSAVRVWHANVQSFGDFPF